MLSCWLEGVRADVGGREKRRDGGSLVETGEQSARGEGSDKRVMRARKHQGKKPRVAKYRETLRYQEKRTSNKPSSQEPDRAILS